MKNTNTSQDTTLEWALRYHAAGWKIFPCRNKQPHFEALKFWGGSWKKARDADIDEGTIRWWWQTYPDAQIAVACGKQSGISVIDIDCIKSDSFGGVPHESYDSPADLATKWCKSITSITGSGGRHVFCTNADIPNSTKTVHSQIDIKSEDGYVILPPSLHANGKRYEWDPLFPWSEASISQMAQFPTQLTQDARHRNPKDWSRIVSGSSQGQRNCNAASLAGKLIRHFEAHEAWELVSSWNKVKNIPSLPEKELETTFLSIIKKHYARHPRSNK